MTELIDRHLGQYHLTEIVGRGGMSTVYKAYQEALDRYVAVKVLLSNGDPQFAARFMREARAMAALQHHNILPIFDVGEQDSVLFLVLQYVEKGASLGDLLGKPLLSPVALRLTAHVLDALDYAHKRGIIHRDIKPSNVLMPSPTWPMLGDFGIVKLINDNQQRLTLAHQIIGTAAYMAPEQATGRTIDARTDLYAAGVVLYELVTGRVPFDGETPLTVLSKHVYEAPPPARSLNPDLPVQVEQVLQRALSKDPNARYQSAAEMAKELHRVAVQLEQNRSPGWATGLYEIGVEAFEAGRWDLAVERLRQVVEVDPEYEDAAQLLAAARDAQERSKTEARQQIEIMRQRRQSGIQPQIRPATEAQLQPAQPAPDILAQPASPPTPPSTGVTQLQSAEAPPIPLVRSTTQLETAGPPARPPTAGVAAAPATTTPPQMAGGAAQQSADAVVVRRQPLPWIIAATVGVVLLLALLLVWRPWQRQATGSATSAPVPTASGSTSVAIGAPSLSAASPTTSAPTAVPTAAPPAELPAPAGKLVYEDDFSAGAQKSGLVGQQFAPDLALAVDPSGVYSMQLSQPNQARWVFLPRLAAGDFSVQIDLSDGSPDFNGGAAQGLVFRGRDNDHFYALLIEPRKGEYILRKQDGKDTWTDLIVSTPSPLIRQNDGLNQLRIDAAGDTFTLYLNGGELASASDDAFTFGMVGTIVANADAAVSTMRFDNLKIWSNDPPPRASALPATRQGLLSDMVLIPGGEFVMGSNDDVNDLPHIVAQPDFYIDSKEVTNLAYANCADSLGCSLPASQDSATRPGYANTVEFHYFPVVNVSWEQASFFCEQAEKRLPTEAEWEKAASWSAVTRTKVLWPFGDTFDVERLNSVESARGDTVMVGTFPINLNNTFDMAGNAAEWTSSLSKPYPYDLADGREDPRAAGDRVVRGGSWAQPQDKVTTSTREPTAPAAASNSIGFRCAVTP